MTRISGIDWDSTPHGTAFCQCDRTEQRPGFKTRLHTWRIDERRLGQLTERPCPRCGKSNDLRAFTTNTLPASNALSAIEMQARDLGGPVI